MPNVSSLLSTKTGPFAGAKDTLICLRLPGACCHIKTPLEVIAMVSWFVSSGALGPSQLQYWLPHHSNQSLYDGSAARLRMYPPFPNLAFPVLSRNLHSEKKEESRKNRSCWVFFFFPEVWKIELNCTYSFYERPFLKILLLQLSLFVAVCFLLPLTATLFERERVALILSESNADNFSKLQRW